MLVFPAQQNLRRLGWSFLVNMLAHLGSEFGGDGDLVVALGVLMI